MDLIDRQAAIEKLKANLVYMQTFGVDRSITLIEEVPSADAQPVRHGKWQITEAYPHNVYCSECHSKFAQTHWAVWEDKSLPRKFCPNCGARMDGE